MSQDKLDKGIEELGDAEFDTVLCTQLIDTITRRLQIEFLYKDDPYFICHPHVLFRGLDNVIYLEGFRPGGGFRDYDIRHIRDLVITDRSFEPDFTIDRDNPKYRQILSPVQNV